MANALCVRPQPCIELSRLSCVSLPDHTVRWQRAVLLEMDGGTVLSAYWNTVTEYVCTTVPCTSPVEFLHLLSHAIACRASGHLTVLSGPWLGAAKF